jgi:hypothetical protein
MVKPGETHSQMDYTPMIPAGQTFKMNTLPEYLSKKVCGFA